MNIGKAADIWRGMRDGDAYRDNVLLRFKSGDKLQLDGGFTLEQLKAVVMMWEAGKIPVEDRTWVDEENA